MLFLCLFLLVNPVFTGEPERNWHKFNEKLDSLMKAGNYKEAAKVTQDYLADTRSLFSEDHPYYASALNNLAVIQYKTGYKGKALANWQKALELKIKIWGDTSPRTLGIRRNLSQYYLGENKFAEAEEMLGGMTKLSGASKKSRNQTGRFLFDLAVIRYYRGQWTETIKNLNETLTTEAKFGSSNATTTKTGALLFDLAIQTGDTAGYRKTLSRLRGLRGAVRPPAAFLKYAGWGLNSYLFLNVPADWKCSESKDPEVELFCRRYYAMHLARLGAIEPATAEIQAAFLLLQKRYGKGHMHYKLQGLDAAMTGLYMAEDAASRSSGLLATRAARRMARSLQHPVVIRSYLLFAMSLSRMDNLRNAGHYLNRSSELQEKVKIPLAPEYKFIQALIAARMNVRAKKLKETKTHLATIDSLFKKNPHLRKSLFVVEVLEVRIQLSLMEKNPDKAVALTKKMRGNINSLEQSLKKKKLPVSEYWTKWADRLKKRIFKLEKRIQIRNSRIQKKLERERLERKKQKERERRKAEAAKKRKEKQKKKKPSKKKPAKNKKAVKQPAKKVNKPKSEKI